MSIRKRLGWATSARLPETARLNPPSVRIQKGLDTIQPMVRDALIWSSLQPGADGLAAAHAEITQLKFLLASAPMIEVPTGEMMLHEFPRRSTSPYAYIHPKTMAKLSFQPVLRHVIKFPGSPTSWVLTSLMPEGRVIFSPLQIPGLEQILAQ